MCSGSVDSVYILRALLSGADGVLVGGCNPGDCHYVSGNFKSRRRIAALKTILDTLGLENDRVWLRWISAAEGQKFAATMREFTDKIKALGPSPFRNNWSV
jgi:F420-non-reducing hydrogenase iron-sulfur subunit